MLWALSALVHALATTAPPKAPRATLEELYHAETAAAAERRVQADATQGRLSALGAARDLWPLPPRLKPHDIPVITLDHTLTADALESLLTHQCCAVHVRGFVDGETCEQITNRLSSSSSDDAFSNWNIHQAKSSTTFTATEVDKVGVTSGEALESFPKFREYLEPTSPNAVESLLPGDLNPFTLLRGALDTLHPQGCRLNQLNGWPMPAGTFRRMYTSNGLIHADTATLLAREAGEFSANLYISTPPGRGALSVYPAQQYAAEAPDAGDGVGVPLTSPALLADLQSLARRQAAGFDTEAQEALRSALPLQHTIDVSDGDLVLINTGRFHRVEPYSEPAFRLSGQCWLSYRRGKALRMWV